MPAKNYKKILTELFRKYNPAKIGEVDALLTQFAGREDELVRKIKLKYAGKASSSRIGRKPKRKPLVMLLVFLLLGGLGLGGWYAANRGLIPGLGENTELDNGETIVEKIPDGYEEKDGYDLADYENSQQATYSAPPMEYGVQVGLFSDPDNAKVKDRLGNRQMELNVLPADNDLYMYVVGNDLELEAARSRRDELRENGFPDAFVVGLRKGKRVEVKPGE